MFCIRNLEAVIMCLTPLITLLLCISYLPIKSNAIMTVSLANVNFTYVYQDKLSGAAYEYIPRWDNVTGCAYRYHDNGYYNFNESKAYTYPKYVYILNTTYEFSPKLPSNLTLKDTNFCDEYAIGPWGYWAVSKTNGVSHSVNQPNLNRETLLTPYLEPYALNNHTAVEDRVSIWDIVTEGGSTGEDDSGKLVNDPLCKDSCDDSSDDAFTGKGLKRDMRLAIIFVSISFFINNLVLKILLDSKQRTGCIILISCIFTFISFVFSFAGLFAIVFALTKVQGLIDGLLDNKDRLTRIGATWKVGHQMLGLLGTCIALSFFNIIATGFLGMVTAIEGNT